MDSTPPQQGKSPDQPLFVPNAPDAGPERRRRSSCLSPGCIGTTAVAVVGFVAALWMAMYMIGQITQRVLVPTMTQAMTTVVGAPRALLPNGSFSMDGMFKDLGPSIADAMLLSWGIDRAAENARRLQYVADALDEYERLHGHPPASLHELNILAGDRSDIWGVPLEYRLVGSPPAWQIRSAGRDRTLDQADPWLPAR